MNCDDSYLPVSHQVQGRVGVLRDGLVLEQLFAKVTVEAEKVAELSSRVNLGLDDGLGLTQHGAGVHVCSVLARDHVGHLQEHVHPLLQWHFLPLLLGLQRRLDGLLDQVRSGPIKLGHLFLMIMRL